MSYEKHHSPSNQIIPEDEHQEVQIRVVRQVKGVDSNKLQPIIRHHNDKDFRVCSTADIAPMNYRQIVYKLPPISPGKRNPKGSGGGGVNKENTVDYSLDINESGDIIDVLNDQDDDNVLKKASSTSGNSSSMF
jgi:hypothetical protein